MKICFIAGCLAQGGAERQLFYNLKFLKNKGIDPLVICFTKGDHWEKKIINLSIKVINIHKQKNPLSKLLKIILLLRYHRVDIVQSQHFFTNIYTYLASMVLRIKGIGTIRSDVFNGDLGKKFSLWRRISLIAPKELCINSKNAIENANYFGVRMEKMHYIPNVIDVDNSVISIKEKNNKKITILYVGQLVPNKRVSIFIDVIKKLKLKTNFNVEGIIIGGGIDFDSLISICNNDPLIKDLIKFHGILDSADLMKYYKFSDIFLFCSKYEGSPNVIIEAMSSGLPIVASNVGGIAELITHMENGYLVEIDNIRDYYRYVKKLCENNKIRDTFGKRAKYYIIKERSLNSLMKYYRKINVLDK